VKPEASSLRSLIETSPCRSAVSFVTTTPFRFCAAAGFATLTPRGRRTAASFFAITRGLEDAFERPRLEKASAVPRYSGTKST
jgi:hypothetical protein